MDHIVVGDRVLLSAGFHAARNRLRLLVRDGILLSASETAYGEGITGLVQAVGPPAGMTRLATARLEDLTETYDCAHLTLQWEAIAADGKLFTALDADLMLVPAGGQLSALAAAERRHDRDRALAVMLDRYLQHADTGLPVHTWPIAG